MGSWALDPFGNDDAADFLAEAEGSPKRAVTAALRAVARAPAGAYLDVDLGAAARAAGELVAIAFGYDPAGEFDEAVGELAARLRPTEPLRLLALEALPRVADRTRSELAALWGDSHDGPAFEAAIADLRARLDAAAAGARKPARREAGDVLLLPEGVLVQVVNAREAAVFAGTYADDDAALAGVGAAAARRVFCRSGALRRGRVVGRRPLRKELRGKKFYAVEMGSIDGYTLMASSGPGSRDASFDEALTYDALAHYDEGALRSIARGELPVARVCPPDEREAALRSRHGADWAQRREITTPGPFGDLDALTRLVHWMHSEGVDNVVARHGAIASGASGYGRPNEDSERGPYAFAGIVALWIGRWPPGAWPDALAGHLPAAPAPELLAEAHAAARALVDAVLTRDAALRLIWSEADDGGAALAASVASLREALAP